MSQILLSMAGILHQLRLVVYPIIYRFYTSFRWLGMGFLNHQQYHGDLPPNIWAGTLELFKTSHLENSRPNLRFVTLKDTWQKSSIWVFPKIGVGKPHFNRVFQYFHHPFWGTIILGNTHICMSFIVYDLHDHWLQKIHSNTKDDPTKMTPFFW